MSTFPVLQIGDQAPAFTLEGGAGQKFLLQSYAGKKIVLYFYPKDDTSGCTKEALEFNALRADFAAANTVIIGISPDSVASHEKFTKKHALTFPLVADEDKHMLLIYGVWVEKSMYGRKYMGVERTTFLVDTAGKIAKIWQKVKVPGHAAEVLDAARAL